MRVTGLMRLKSLGCRIGVWLEEGERTRDLRSFFEDLSIETMTERIIFVSRLKISNTFKMKSENQRRGRQRREK